MPVHRSHNRPMPAPPRPDELPQGVPAPLPARTGADVRDSKGRFAKGNRSAASAGGRARKERVEHLHRLGLDWLTQAPKPSGDPSKDAATAQMVESFTEHRRQGSRQLKAEQSWLMRTVGGGVLDPLAAAELRNAVTKETLAHLLLENPKMAGPLGKTVALADKLLTAARGHRLTALELSARAAQARLQTGGGAGRIDVQAIDVSETLRELLASSTSTEGSNDDDE